MQVLHNKNDEHYNTLFFKDFMNKKQAEEQLTILRKALAEAKTETEKEKITLEISKVIAICMSLNTPLNRMIQ